MLTDYLSLLDVRSPATVVRGDDYYSSAISSSEYIWFGYSSETTVHVSGSAWRVLNRDGCYCEPIATVISVSCVKIVVEWRYERERDEWMIALN